MKESICTTCGYVGKPVKIIKGSVLLELLLWLCFLLPGIFYSVWRSNSRVEICPKCKNSSMIPVDSPVGQKLVADQSKK
jgi:hypothetical protein